MIIKKVRTFRISDTEWNAMKSYMEELRGIESIETPDSVSVPNLEIKWDKLPPQEPVTLIDGHDIEWYKFQWKQQEQRADGLQSELDKTKAALVCARNEVARLESTGGTERQSAFIRVLQDKLDKYERAAIVKNDVDQTT
jgi:hypothetical protein